MQKHQFPVGGGSKKVEDWGGAGVKKFRTGGYWGVPMLGGEVTFAGGSKKC